MNGFDENLLSNQTKKVLLVADVSAAVFGARSGQLPCRMCDNIFDAVQILEKENFTDVVIQMSKIADDAVSAIRAVRKIKPNVHIDLLAEMAEEPVALNLVQGQNGRRVADDYYICPVSREFFDVQILNMAAPTNSKLLVAEETYDKDEKIKILAKLATEDDLTGVKNRRYLFAFLSHLLKIAERNELKITLLLFDIDNFKHYNDEYGHTEGDKVLQQAAKVMEKCIRKQDIVARIGGDEFAVVFWSGPKAEKRLDDRRGEQSNHPSEALIVAKRFKDLINSESFPSLGPAGQGKLTISGGLASFGKDGITLNELFEQADKALLEAKRNGKNQICIVGKNGVK